MNKDKKLKCGCIIKDYWGIKGIETCEYHFHKKLQSDIKTMLKISPALLNDLQAIAGKYGYNLIHSVINSKTKNHRFIFTDQSIKLLIEFSKYENR